MFKQIALYSGHAVSAVLRLASLIHPRIVGGVQSTSGATMGFLDVASAVSRLVQLLGTRVYLQRLRVIMSLRVLQRLTRCCG